MLLWDRVSFEGLIEKYSVSTEDCRFLEIKNSINLFKPSWTSNYPLNPYLPPWTLKPPFFDLNPLLFSYPSLSLSTTLNTHLFPSNLHVPPWMPIYHLEPLSTFTPLSTSFNSIFTPLPFTNLVSIITPRIHSVYLFIFACTFTPFFCLFSTLFVYLKICNKICKEFFPVCFSQFVYVSRQKIQKRICLNFFYEWNYLVSSEIVLS